MIYKSYIKNQLFAHLGYKEASTLCALLYGDRGYFTNEFYDCVKGLEKEPEGGKRCVECFKLRLEKTAMLAKEGGYDYFTTTLTISPLKNSQILNEIGKEMSEKYQVEYLYSDFKKKSGYLRSCELSEKYGLYRQNFCGCIFSKINLDKDSDI